MAARKTFDEFGNHPLLLYLHSAQAGTANGKKHNVEEHKDQWIMPDSEPTSTTDKNIATELNKVPRRDNHRKEIERKWNIANRIDKARKQQAWEKASRRCRLDSYGLRTGESTKHQSEKNRSKYIDRYS